MGGNERKKEEAKRGFFARAVDLYVDGFRSMTIGRTLWLIVIIKLFVMFVILKALFFPNFLNTQFDDDSQKSNYVAEELIKRSR